MAKSISALTIAQYRALVTGIPLYCANATFTVASQTFTATEAVAFISSVLAAVSATLTELLDHVGWDYDAEVAREELPLAVVAAQLAETSDRELKTYRPAQVLQPRGGIVAEEGHGGSPWCALGATLYTGLANACTWWCTESRHD
jgi:hypothetical protein